MRTLKFNFCHPVKGLARFICPSDRALQKTIKLETTDNGLVEIPLDDFQEGKWQFTLEWEFNGKEYYRMEEICI